MMQRWIRDEIQAINIIFVIFNITRWTKKAIYRRKNYMRSLMHDNNINSVVINNRTFYVDFTTYRYMKYKS